MTTEKELAYRYDLFVAPDWRNRYDTLLSDNVEIPLEATVLDAGCGTGGYAVDLAGLMRPKGGDVVGVDPSDERLELARARALVVKLDNVRFQNGSILNLPFEDERFDAVIGDASMFARDQVRTAMAEVIRVARPGAPVILKITSRGSFDEFFSVYWEALHDSELDAESWAPLEELINDRMTTSAAESMAANAGLRNASNVTSKEEFVFDSGEDFLTSPLVADNFLAGWLSIVPEEKRPDILRKITEIIEHDRHEGTFDISIKATLIFGVK